MTLEQQVLAYLRANTGTKKSAQIAKETKIKPHKLTEVLRALRHEGVVTFSHEEGWKST